MKKLFAFLRSKAFVFGAAALFLLFFSNDFGMIDIQKTSIVTAIGIDAAAQQDLVDVTAQIAVPDETGKKASNVAVKGAATVGEAIAEFNQKTGWYPTLVHCRLILLGEDTAKRNVFEVLDFFLRSQFVEDSCLIAVCEGRADEALQAKSPVGDLTFSAIEKVLSSEAQKTGLVSVTSLREFAIGYYSKSGSGFLPYLSVRQEATDGTAGGSSSPAAQQEGGASGGTDGGSGGNGADVFDASRTMLFSAGKAGELLTPEETLAFNLAEAKTDFAYGDVKVTENGKEVTYNLKMKIKKKSAAVRPEGGVPVLTFRIRANAQAADANTAAARDEIVQTAFVPEHVLRAAEEKLRSELESVLKKCAACGCDLFGVRRSIRKKYPGAYEEIKDKVPAGIVAAFDIRFDTLR